MLITLTLDPDEAAKAKAGAAQLGKPFKEVVNAALRLGLELVLRPPASKPYRTQARPMGLRRGFNYDNIGELLARAEGRPSNTIASCTRRIRTSPGSPV